MGMQQKPDEFDPTIFSAQMSSSSMAGRLKMEAKRIFEGVESRRRSKTRAKDERHRWGESADDWLMVEVYLLVRRLKRIRRAAALGDAVANSPVRHKGRHDIGKQPFKQALFLIFADSMVPSFQSPLNRQRRSLFGDALAYADAHDVPPAYVNGFIKQAGLHRCRAKLKALYEEPRSSRSDVIEIV